MSMKKYNIIQFIIIVISALIEHNIKKFFKITDKQNMNKITNDINNIINYKKFYK